MKIGKIKFSEGRQKLDHFRICDDSKDPKGNWKLAKGFEGVHTELRMYFPFAKMENNISIKYSGYAKLSATGKRGGPLDTYFIQSQGLGEPIYARPEGHSGVIYDGRSEDKPILLTQERLDQWKMVKKRLQMVMVPEGHDPSDFIVWHTTSEVAFAELLKKYSDLQKLTGSIDISLLPLTFFVRNKQFTNSKNQPVKFSHGNVRFEGSLSELADAIERAEQLRTRLGKGLEALESEWEHGNIFYADDDDEVVSALQPGVVQDINQETGEITYKNAETGEAAQPEEDLSRCLDALLPKDSAKEVVRLAIKHGKKAEMLKLHTAVEAMVFMSKMRSLELAAS